MKFEIAGGIVGTAPYKENNRIKTGKGRSICCGLRLSKNRRISEN